VLACASRYIDFVHAMDRNAGLGVDHLGVVVSMSFPPLPSVLPLYRRHLGAQLLKNALYLIV
jgi:hypothetical protein